MKSQIDWLPLSEGSVRPTQGRTLAVMQVSGGSQAFNAVNALRMLGRWMRMITIPNQSSVPKAYQEFDEAGRMKPGPLYDRVVDVCEELMKFTLLTRERADYLVDRYSERKERCRSACGPSTPISPRRADGIGAERDARRRGTGPDRPGQGARRPSRRRLDDAEAGRRTSSDTSGLSPPPTPRAGAPRRRRRSCSRPYRSRHRGACRRRPGHRSGQALAPLSLAAVIAVESAAPAMTWPRSPSAAPELRRVRRG